MGDFILYISWAIYVLEGKVWEFPFMPSFPFPFGASLVEKSNLSNCGLEQRLTFPTPHKVENT